MWPALMLCEDGGLRCWSEIEKLSAFLLATAWKQALGSLVERVASVRSSTYLSSGMIPEIWLPMRRPCPLLLDVQDVAPGVDCSSSWSYAVVFVNEEDSYARRNRKRRRPSRERCRLRIMMSSSSVLGMFFGWSGGVAKEVEGEE